MLGLEFNFDCRMNNRLQVQRLCCLYSFGINVAGTCSSKYKAMVGIKNYFCDRATLPVTN